jgi:predicted DCC family thiol-disulfide oxidoreductase YuxK
VAAPAGQHLLLYDGGCALCSRAVRFVLSHDRAGVFCFAPLEGPTASALLAALGHPPPALDTLLVIAELRGAARVLDRSQAILFVLSCLRPPFRWLGALARWPSPLLDRGYDLVARHRRRRPAPFEGCPRGDPAWRARFLDR